MADLIDKRDLDIILEVNKKSVEIETEVAEQNEKIIEMLDTTIENGNEIDDRISKLDLKINVIDGKVSSIDNKYSILDSKIGNLENKIFSTEMAVSATEFNLNKKIDAIETKISSSIQDNTNITRSQHESLSRDMFQIRVLLGTGILSLIAQLIQIFMKK